MRYEYKTFLYRGVGYYSQLDKRMNELDEDGWEVVAIFRGLEHVQGDWFWVTCKKPRSPTTEEE